MQKGITLIFKAVKFYFTILFIKFSNIYTWFKFYSNNIEFKKFDTNGIPFVMIAIGGYCKIGNNFRMNNGLRGNPIGRPQPCIFFVDKGASLIIGDNVGISSVALIAHESIIIGNNVKIGGGVCIYDTDFHSLDPQKRKCFHSDRTDKVTRPVCLKDNVFIGAHSTILKGVTIGENSIIGACSVITKDIPSGEIWAGNPARRIRLIG